MRNDLIEKVTRLLEMSRYKSGTSIGLIQFYSDPSRTQLVKEFGSDITAKEYEPVNLKSVSNRFDRASEGGYIYRGFYWRVTRLTDDEKVEVIRRIAV